MQPIRSHTYLLPSQGVTLKLKEHLHALPLLPIMLGDIFSVTAVLSLLLAEFPYTPRKHKVPNETF